MPIQILSPQLANQIAAGEVVERPSSVVKELLENSLDAGANDIRIDIENGGARLIRIRDNGSGIAKQELTLSLARHATSKISSLEDLEAILSFGFRGEALASISSVSRLTLTSRTAEQAEAWQVYAQGREMETTVTPAAHPVGTTVEVANLFFNTPARRKFLRSEKTEFAHIDEVIRRIALAKPHIAFTLSHNGKCLRQYKQALNDKQKLKRLATICGEEFVHNALQIDWKHDSLHLYGWIARPQFYRQQNDLSYCYVNGRMIRDKVINHAIKQAYAEYLNNEQFPAFVLFIDLNPNEVDVNVHPTKHEVRFHQQRLVHDFIYQGIIEALATAQLNFSELSANPNKEEKTRQAENQVNETAAEWRSTPHVSNRSAAGQNIFHSPSFNMPSKESQKHANFRPHFSSTQQHYKTEQQLYGQLLQDSTHSFHEDNETKGKKADIETKKNTLQPATRNELVNTVVTPYLQALALVEDDILLLQQNRNFYLLCLKKLQRLKCQLTLQQQEMSRQPLLIPLVLRLTEQQFHHWLQQKVFFTQAGFDFSEHPAQSRITLNAVPVCLRQQNLQKCVIALLSQQIEKNTEFLTALCGRLEHIPISVLADAVNLLTETERLIEKQPHINLQSLLTPIDFSRYLTDL